MENLLKDKFYIFLSNHNLPKKVESGNIRDAFIIDMRQFTIELEDIVQNTKSPYNIHSEEFYSRITSNIDKIKETTFLIEKIFTEFDNCNNTLVEAHFDELMSLLKNDLVIANTTGINQFLSTGGNFTRIRSVDKEKRMEPNDLFHIRFEERQLTRNYRYSISGHPCLYISSNIRLAWDECEWPSKFYYSKFEVPTDLSFIYFIQPNIISKYFLGSPINNEYDSQNERMNFIINYINTYPLLLSCSYVKNANPNAAFFQEYIVPQLLMQWIKRNEHKDSLIGISYFPCKESKILQTNGYNLAIPAFEYSHQGLCSYLRPIIKNENPKYFDHSIKKSDKEEIDAILEYFTNLLREYISNSTDSKIAKLIYFSIEICQNLLPLANDIDNSQIKIAYELIKCINEKSSNFRIEHLIELEKSIQNKKKSKEIIKNINCLKDIIFKYYNSFDKVIL